MLQQYNSLEAALRHLFPKFDWHSSRFYMGVSQQRPRGFWANLENQKSALERIGKLLGVQQVPHPFHRSISIINHVNIFHKLSDWYEVWRSDVDACGGGPLFRFYPSVEAMLRAVYPHFPWKRSRFSVPVFARNQMKDPQYQKGILETIGKELDIKEVTLPLFFGFLQ